MAPRHRLHFGGNHMRQTFERAVAAERVDPSASSGGDWGALDLFRDFLSDPISLSQVPVLNPENLSWVRPNTLVRFRGMVQDMLGNEFYVGAFKDGSKWRTNKFTDVASFPMAPESEQRLWERRLYYCVPVPGQNSWTLESPCSSEAVKNIYGNLGSSPQGEKRPRDAGVDCMDVNVDEGSPSCSKKQEEALTTVYATIYHNMYTFLFDNITRLTLNKAYGPTCHSLPSNAIPTNRVATKHGRSTLKEYGLPSQSLQSAWGVENKERFPTCRSHVPDFDANSLPCLVKIYDSLEDELKLNDVFEFIGVLTFDSEILAHNGDPTDFPDLVQHCDSTELPSCKVPRLHCLTYRRLYALDFLQNFHVTEPLPNLVRSVRDSLLGHLTVVLGNDGTVANFVLLHLLSRVHARVDSLAVGKLSLNLTGFIAESISIFGSQLNNILKSLLPFTRTIPLTMEYLNSASFAPKKDYQTNRLVPGVLQVAQGTHVTVDETLLKPGMLISTGVENARLLKYLIESQKVEYEFEYYKLEMPADVQILILSEGKSNILPADVVVPFRPSNVSSAVNISSEDLQAWRWYLATLRELPHSIEPETQKIIEDDMVKSRQEDRSLGPNDFSRWMTMSRLISASLGETNLSLEHWKMAKELDRLRKERLN
ncbi:Mini-chromosome maintenance complex-binding protein [Acorus gramineus]|uniref:Mini-chromosome maintenance complex-binding protein n=1 Tax=Acorus gramineus TaxID=55184 RepID=A0AAV9AKT7_ACOGR|nr:Mini-chromosome maintenance complex-binding protein [Acorus gramineus]